MHIIAIDSIIGQHNVVMYTTSVFRKSAFSDPWPNPTHYN